MAVRIFVLMVFFRTFAFVNQTGMPKTVNRVGDIKNIKQNGTIIIQ